MRVEHIAGGAYSLCHDARRGCMCRSACPQRLNQVVSGVRLRVGHRQTPLSVLINSLIESARDICNDTGAVEFVLGGLFYCAGEECWGS